MCFFYSFLKVSQEARMHFNPHPGGNYLTCSFHSLTLYYRKIFYGCLPKKSGPDFLGKIMKIAWIKVQILENSF